MTPVLVDSNVILDIATEDREWREWSERAMVDAVRTARLVINPIIFAEASTRYGDVGRVDRALPADMFVREALPYAAAFLAARAYVIYRRRGGARRSPLPDFYIGAHAAIARYRLLTRDAARYRTYFPTVDLITPPSA